MVQPNRTPLHTQIVDDVGKAIVREARRTCSALSMFFHAAYRALFRCIDVKPLITRTFEFEDSVEMKSPHLPKGEVKMQTGFLGKLADIDLDVLAAGLEVRR